MTEFNAICPECEKPIFINASNETVNCPKCGKSIYTSNAVALFENSFSTKNGELVIPKVGESVFFGRYAQDDPSEKKAIEWVVLDVKDGRALVISKYGLDCKPYNKNNARVKWASCSLREWLNGEFLDSAFSEFEKAAILLVDVPADKNASGKTPPRSATKDKLFLLSVAEAKGYFSSEKARQCAPTAYAVAQGVGVNSGNGWWWLRSGGYLQGNAAYISCDGKINDYGMYFNNSRYSVRPAMWIEY